ncbi:hypothetical protein [Lentzea sp. NPDC055074]
MRRLTGGARLSAMANVRVTYDAQANAAYIHLTAPQADVKAARSKLSPYLLDAAERID